MSSQSHHKALIIAEVMHAPDHKSNRREILHKYWMHFNSKDLDEIMQSFHESGLILIRPGDPPEYEMPPVQYVKMKKFLEGKNE